jgi:hypothetical protein
MLHTKVVEEIIIQILCSVAFFPKIVPFMRYMEKYGTARHATDDNIIRRMRFTCWITKATDTHVEYVILIAFPRQQRTRLNVTLDVGCLVQYVIQIFRSENLFSGIIFVGGGVSIVQSE